MRRYVGDVTITVTHTFQDLEVLASNETDAHQKMIDAAQELAEYDSILNEGVTDYDVSLQEDGSDD